MYLKYRLQVDSKVNVFKYIIIVVEQYIKSHENADISSLI